jgi:hypothetical protein
MQVPFGDEMKLLELWHPVGGPEGYNVTIDGFYAGQIYKLGDKWEAGHLPPTSILQTEDIALLGEIIDGVSKGQSQD